jgi:hypothetical protein
MRLGSTCGRPFDAPFLLEVAEHAVEIVRLDFHSLGNVRSADARRFLDQRDGLITAATAAAFAPAFRRTRAGGGIRFAPPRPAGPTRAGFTAELIEGALELPALILDFIESAAQQSFGLVDHGGARRHLTPFPTTTSVESLTCSIHFGMTSC